MRLVIKPLYKSSVFYEGAVLRLLLKRETIAIVGKKKQNWMVIKYCFFIKSLIVTYLCK
ncbi:hypothetical protein SAMN04487911_1027 [Arenibacter nanhaiticus]|uniref:Uncharacterized protein n=1 Tax=Arenibacter nanhaiticus TaxID=558155 RepID=A0A1M6AYL4_9FLAO|nr:hypothetical protein SAMN04487911_1027 [Arenibacter nanhaiticus]